MIGYIAAIGIGSSLAIILPLLLIFSVLAAIIIFAFLISSLIRGHFYETIAAIPDALLSLLILIGKPIAAISICAALVFIPLALHYKRDVWEVLARGPEYWAKNRML